MKTPRFFLGVVLLLWGVHHNLLLVAICLLLALESACFFRFRFVFEPADFNKFVDISIVLLAGIIAFALSTESQKAVSILARWLPLILSPMVIAQQWSATGKIDTRVFLFVSRKKNRMAMHEGRQIDISYLYALIVLLSTGGSHLKTSFFYTGVCVLFLWALWQSYPARINKTSWILCALVVVVMGFACQKAVYQAGVKAKYWMMGYFSQYYNVNPYKTVSAMGSIGKLKLSDSIAFRVMLPQTNRLPGHVLLQNTTYNVYGRSAWYERIAFENVLPGKEKHFWQIQPDKKNVQTMIVYSRLVKNRAVLILPAGVISISQMKVGVCEKNGAQSIRVEGGPSLIKSLVTYTGTLSYDLPPDKRDLIVPTIEQENIEKVVKLLDLENQSPAGILKTVKTYFSTQFKYSLDLKGKGAYATPLGNFLHHTKAGHCELFATATALILRQVKLPVRYVTGYAANEYSALEKCFVVRNRDAHAWVKVYINGQWQMFDTTPSSFLQEDSQNVPVSYLKSFLSFLSFKLSQLRHETGEKIMRKYGLWLILPLAVILFFRLKKSNTIRQVTLAAQKRPSGEHSFKTHDFYRIQVLLEEKGYPKLPWETYHCWRKRIIAGFSDPGMEKQFQNVLDQYQQWRFGRKAFDKLQMAQFDQDVELMVQQIRQLP